jgi:hypothetical protein
MKAFFMSLILLFQAGALASGSLKETMSNMDARYKAVAKQVSAGQMNQDTIQAVQEFEQFTHVALMQIPSKLEPVEENREDHIAYQRMILQVFGLGLDLEEAVTAASQADAKKVLAKLADLKLQGHQIFKP